MTFKHVKFEDSPIMRSLEKVAKEKGLIKPEVLQKKAAVTKRADFTPSSNLMDNIFKLCAGMRIQGLEKEASEVEMNYLNYKRAQTLYEAHKEKGEDLIHAAHPDGSHKLEGVDGEEATFEDILDQHVKILQKIEKAPSGKLSSAAQIVNAVKTVLAQSTADLLKGLVDQSKAKFTELLNAVKGAQGTSAGSGMGRLSMIAPITRVWNNAAGGPTAETIRAGQATISNCKRTFAYIDPTELQKLDKAFQDRSINESDRARYLLTIQTYSAWQATEAALNDLNNLLGQMLQYATAGDAAVISKIDAQIKRLDRTFRSLLNDPGFTPQDKKDGNNEIDGFVKTLNSWKAVLSGVDAADKATQSKVYDQKLTELIPAIDQLYKEITGA